MKNCNPCVYCDYEKIKAESDRLRAELARVEKLTGVKAYAMTNRVLGEAVVELETQLEQVKRERDEAKADLAECYKDYTEMTEKWMNESKALELACSTLYQDPNGNGEYEVAPSPGYFRTKASE